MGFLVWDVYLGWLFTSPCPHLPLPHQTRRHAVITDQNTGEKYTPLSSVYPGQKPGQFTVSNSSLSE